MKPVNLLPVKIAQIVDSKTDIYSENKVNFFIRLLISYFITDLINILQLVMELKVNQHHKHISPHPTLTFMIYGKKSTFLFDRLP